MFQFKKLNLKSHFYLTLPPAFSIFSLADTEIKQPETKNFLSISPLPRILIGGIFPPGALTNPYSTKIFGVISLLSVSFLFKTSRLTTAESFRNDLNR